jgi:hypothetical protein
MEPTYRALSLPVKEVQELFSYDPVAGTITRLVSYGKAKAGQIFSEGNVSVLGIHIRFSRLAWALHHGSWPPKGYWVDHINRIKADNRLVNLRLVTPTQNQQNKAGSGTYAKGVTWRDRKQKPWQAQIRVNGERIHLGSFQTHDEAAEAYREAAAKYHGEFACPK